MVEPTTYIGYKAGTLAAIILGAGVTAGITQGPIHLRLVSGASGAATSFVATPVFAPIAVKLAGVGYGWWGIGAEQVPDVSIIGLTGFFMALIGIDLCRWIIDASKKMLAKIPLGWPGKKP